MRLVSVCVAALVGAFGLALGCSASQPEESRGTVQQEIQGGQPDTTHRFAVGVCSGSPGSCSGVCSGALILPNVVATARHCVDASPFGVDCAKDPKFGPRLAGSYYVTTNSTLKQGGPAGWYKVKSIHVPADDRFCGNDIALLVTDPIPAQDTTPITPGVQHMMWDTKQYDPVFTAIGYGVTGPDKNDSQTRRIRKYIPVLCIPGAPVRACPQEVMDFMSEKEFLGGDGVCSGDSGSSAFEASTFDKGAPVSFGVLSRGGEARPDGGEPQCVQSVYTRFDAHRDFVLKVAKEASENWTLYPEPSWTAYVAPPAPKQPKDGGADDDDDDAPPKPPARALGEECTKASDCESKLCVETEEDTFVCSSECEETEETTGCPEGFECRESLCLPEQEPAAEPAGSTKIVKTTGCSAASGASGSPWGFAVGLAGMLLAASRRRSAGSPDEA